MGLFHWPLCIGLAVLSALRFMAHVVMAKQLELRRVEPSAHPGDLLGTMFEF